MRRAASRRARDIWQHRAVDLRANGGGLGRHASEIGYLPGDALVKLR
jgi:hypothetical protein